MTTGVTRFLSQLETIFINGGISPQYSEAKARAIRLSNIIAMTTVFNALTFGLIAWMMDDFFLVKACAVTFAVFSANYIITLSGFDKLGRTSGLICGSFIVFWFSCYFRGDSFLQLFFYTLCVAPFMYFSWEERSRYLFLILLPVVVLLIGEWNDYQFFVSYQPENYNIKVIRIFGVFAPLNQVVLGFYYFLKQSVKYENESKNNLRKLEIEYRKQLQVQKMSSLGEMAGGIAHEINNPLSIIQMKNQIIKTELKNKLPGADEAFRQIAAIESTVSRIAKIIRALLNFSRNAVDDPLEKRDLAGIIDETLELCQQRFATAGIQLQVRTEKDLEVMCRPSEISQVLLNLLNNAYDGVSGRPDALVEVRSRRLPDGQVEIMVEDNGTGISPLIQDKIFDPFFTTKEVGKGTGLGLSISKGLVEGHHGKLRLIPNTGKTSFQVLLPPLI